MITDMYVNGLPEGVELAASTLIVAADSRWESLVDTLSHAVHPADFWSVEQTGKPLTVGEARDLKQFASRTPTGDMKIACLLGADRFRVETANALLKLIEEPPEYVLVVLLAETPYLLPTLSSRVRTVYLPEDSATIEGVGTARARWQTKMANYSTTDPDGRKRLRELLYLYPLVHEGIKAETVVDSF